jgi:hypothetical protein
MDTYLSFKNLRQQVLKPKNKISKPPKKTEKQLFKVIKINK